MTNFIPKQLSVAEIDELQKEFVGKEADLEQAELMFSEMDNYFRNANIETDKDFFLSYFRWYTNLSWKFLQGRDYDFVVNVAVARQIPLAILSGFDVWQDLIWYLAFRAELKSDMESLYGRFREALIKSGAVIGTWQGADYKISDLVNEVQMLDRLGNDSIKEAEFRSKLLQIYLPADNTALQKYVMVDPGEGVDSLIGIVNFFLGVEPANIWYVVDAYLHPEIVGAEEEVEASTVAIVKPAPVLQKPELKEKIPELIQSNQSLPRQSGELVKPVALVKLTPAEIKSQIESQFKKDADGNFADIEGVMAKLNELAEKNNDSKIAEMIYFDETENKFKWNI